MDRYGSESGQVLKAARLILHVFPSDLRLSDRLEAAIRYFSATREGVLRSFLEDEAWRRILELQSDKFSGMTVGKWVDHLSYGHLLRVIFKASELK